MSESLRECLRLYSEDKKVTHIERAFTLLNLASNSWKPGKNFAYTSYDILHLAVVASEAYLSGTAISVINIFESIFGGNNEFSDLVSLLFAEILFQKNDFSISTMDLAMGHVEKSIYLATESDHQVIVNNLLVLLYKFVRMKATLFKRAELPLFLRPKLKLLMDMHIKHYPFILRFGILLLETFIQVGSRKEASQLLDTLAGGVARHVPEQMVELLATASGANLTSAERYVNWALGVYSGNQTELYTYQPTKSSISQAKEKNIPMSGPLAHSLISFGMVPSSRLARLRTSFYIADYISLDSTKNPSEQTEEFLKIIRLLEIQDENNELLTDKQLDNKISSIEDSPVEDTNHNSNNTEMINNSEEIIDDVLSPKFLTTETRFKLLVSLTQLALDRDLLHICLKCIKQCENIIEKEKLSVHYHGMQKCSNLLEQCLSSPIYQPETIIQGCLTLWRLCSPLIQHNSQTRLKTFKSLQLINHHLTKQDSLYFRLRCEVHMMIAYCQADMEKITEALESIDKRTLLIQISKLVDKSIFDEVFKYETIQYGGSKLLSEYKHKSYKELLFQISSYKQIWLQINDVIKHHCEMISENAEYEINEKLLVWFDLIKLAKKYQIWDLCSTFCRLCLVYDDDAYWSTLLKKLEQYRNTRVKPVIGPTTNLKSTDTNLTTQTASKTDGQNLLNKSKPNPRTISNYPDIVTSFELKLYSALSQIYCIFAECLCVLLRQQMCGIQLAGNMNHLNPSWFDISLLINNDSDNDNEDVKKFEEQRDYNLHWKNFCDWFSFVNEAALSAFQRSAVLSARIVDLNNLHSCAVCVWNYCLPTICQNDHRQLTTTFSVILENANKIGSSCLPLQLYIQMATVLAHGLIQPWLPKPLKSTFSVDEKTKPVQLNTQQKSQKMIRGKSAKSSFYIAPPEGHPHIKKAIEWLILAGKLCEPTRLDLLQNIDESYQLQPVVPISTRSSLIACWLLAKQLITNPPVCRNLFPLDLSTETTNYTEINTTSDSDSQTRKLVLTNQKEAQIYLESLITRTLLAVHSLWLTNKHKYITEWPVAVSKLIDEQSTQTLVEPLKQGDILAGFKDSPTLTEAIHLMQLTFCNQKSNVHMEHPTSKSNTIKEQENNIKYDLRLSQAPIERFTELELWTRLAMTAFITSQFSSILDIIDMSNIQIELYQGVKKSDVNINYWLVHLLCLRGLAIFGISNQMKLFRQQNLKTSGKYTQQQQQTRGKQRLTDMKFKHVELLGQKRNKSTTSEDSQSIENSLFEAGEEAFYKASNIAHKIGRYDLLVMSAALYWSLLNHSVLAPSNQITNVLQKIESFSKKIENITKWLGQCMKTEVRNELAAQIRNSENKQDLTTEFSTLKLESILMDSVKCKKEVSSLYETVVIPYPTVNQFEMDLQLRVDMYKALYNVHSEQGNFTEALTVLAKATSSLPRTKHRMSLFRQLVVTKAKLGQSIELDMQKFTSEPEYLQAQIWIEIAYASSDINVQLMAFKQSVNAIKSPDYWVLKSDLLLQFAQWLFAHGYDMPTCISLAEEAVDILNDLYRKHCDLDQCKETKYGQLIFNSENVQYLDILMRACVLLAEFQDVNNANIEQEHDLHSLDYLIIAVNCVKTILNLVTMACLDRLLDLITEMGPGQLGYPILVFQDGLVRSWARYDKSSSFANCTCIRKLIHLKSVELSCCLGLSSGVTNHQNKLNSLLPSEQEIADAYTLLKTNPTDPYIKDLIKSWINLGDRLARIGQCSHARTFLSISEQFILRHNDQMKYCLLARARLALVEGQYRLTRSLISKIFVSSKLILSNGPERVLVVDGDLGSVIEILRENHEKIQSNRDDGVDLRLLVNQSQAGCVIGRAGYKIKELREQSGLHALKLGGDMGKVLDCLCSKAELLESALSKGSRQNYDARSVDEFVSLGYGGWGARSRNNDANKCYPHNNILTTRTFGGDASGATGCNGGQTTTVSQALAGGLPLASAAAMIAATGGRTTGGPNPGMAVDTAATAAAMVAAGLMRGLPNRMAMSILTPTTSTQVSDFNIEDESFWFDCLSIRIDSLCYDPNLTIHNLNLSEINDKQDFMNYSCHLHFGIQTAIKEIDLAINDLQERKENFKSRNGWFNKLQGMLLSKKAQLIARIDEMNYHYCTLFNSSDKSTTCDLSTRPINLLINPNGAPKLFEEVICLLTSNKRTALRLGWMPLLAYWVRGFKHEVNSHITKLRKKSCHPSTLCNSFETTLIIARQCLAFAYETIKLAESFSNLDELKGCSLPVHRDFIEIKFMLITVLHDMMKLHIIYLKTKLQENTLKDPLYCAVENYINENSSDSLIELSNKCDQSKQQIWDHSIEYAFDEVCSLLSDVFIMSYKQPHLLAKCFFYFGESVYLKGQLILPDFQDNWSPQSSDNEAVKFQPIIPNGTFIQELTKQNLEDINLHSGFRWRTHTDVLNDLKTYNSVMDLFSQASSLFIICLKICFAQNFIGLAHQVTESLLNLLGGCHESVSILTQDLLIGYQSCSTAVRLRTHFWLTILAYDARKCSGGTQFNSGVENEYSDRSILNASEALVRQLMWSSPACAYDDDSLFSTLGFCSTTEPSSYPEALAWIIGLKSNLISNRLRSVGGLCSGSEDHSISASPWIPVILKTLTSQSQAWRVTEVNPSIIFDSSKVLQSTLSSLPGSNLQIAKSWNLLIMEHSINSHFLYVAIPKPMNRTVSNRDHRSSIPANKSANKGAFQYTFLRIETDPISRCQLICSWKKSLNHLDEQLKKAANIKSNNSNLFKQITNQILKIRSCLFEDSTEDIQLLNYLNPIFEILSKHWLPEPYSNSNQNKPDDNLGNNDNDPSRIVCQLNKINQLSYQLEQYLNNQSDLSKDGHHNTQKTDDLSDNTHEQSVQHKTSRKPETTRGNSRHPLLRDVGSKLPPLQSCKQQNTGCLLLDTTYVRYLIDPFMDTEIITSINSSDVSEQVNNNNRNDSYRNSNLQNDTVVINYSFKNHFQLLLKEPITRSQQFTSRWIGLVGDSELGKVPSEEELLVFLNEGASGLFSYITENFLSYLPPPIFINLSIPNCHLICLLDKVYTRTSRLRQIRLNAHKTITECELEQPLSMAIISSLVGSRSTILLQWSTRLHWNQFRLGKLIKCK
ncbi:putative heterogeneous nuclear ribonucleoprotein k [Schistosoma mansoni]|uniref:putative heterogeneous nuclear ribonucleoprotein k n=1 Tax=Schistosoma mansoni TaxID=6183 RepID=UPI00022DC647|nr:putative heterogeneous nuclear ribonucleoprotein k [Schistosoma mansoni]|eukprot:XP_018652200.1 putative heterogeneous nuclear ribonucleoprotein k [Schistosoma mansoni]